MIPADRRNRSSRRDSAQKPKARGQKPKGPNPVQGHTHGQETASVAAWVLLPLLLVLWLLTAGACSCEAGPCPVSIFERLWGGRAQKPSSKVRTRTGCIVTDARHIGREAGCLQLAARMVSLVAGCRSHNESIWPNPSQLTALGEMPYRARSMRERDRGREKHFAPAACCVVCFQPWKAS